MWTKRQAVAASASLLLGGTAAGAEPATATPIKHLIVVVGENIKNITFDNLFATWEPRSGESVHNLLSQGIVNRDGRPGPRFEKAIQRRAEAREGYSVTPPITGTYGELPQPGTTYAKNQPHYVGDKRFPELMPNGPFQITKHADYAAHVGDPVHRFFQMWQQIDGGRRDLFVWVAETSGEGSRNRDDPSSGTNQGGVAMGFYNMAAGDAPYFRELADHYAVSDNHHQPVMGGTGANFQALATGHAIAYMRNGLPATPPANQIEIRIRGRAPTTGTRNPDTRAVPMCNVRTPRLPARKRFALISRPFLTRHSTTAIASPAPIIWSITTARGSRLAASPRNSAQRCFASRRSPSRRSRKL
jgi:phospholipase C